VKIRLWIPKHGTDGAAYEKFRACSILGLLYNVQLLQITMVKKCDKYMSQCFASEVIASRDSEIEKNSVVRTCVYHTSLE
jgi:hypothetical protein